MDIQACRQSELLPDKVEPEQHLASSNILCTTAEHSPGDLPEEKSNNIKYKDRTMYEK